MWTFFMFSSTLAGFLPRSSTDPIPHIEGPEWPSNFVTDAEDLEAMNVFSEPSNILDKAAVVVNWLHPDSSYIVTDSVQGTFSQIHLQQKTPSGEPITNARMNINFDKNGKVMSYGTSFYDGPFPTAFTEMPPKEALGAVAAALNKRLNHVRQSQGTLDLYNVGFAQNGGVVHVHRGHVVLGSTEIAPVWVMKFEYSGATVTAEVDRRTGRVISMTNNLRS